MCFGPFKRICHWGPLTALGIIKCVTAMTVHCSGMWWPSTTFGGFLNTFSFMCFSGLTLYNFISSMYHGPGYLPPNWIPKNEKDKNFLQFCKVCNGYKAPRSHHCRKCGKCVLKMDHHCPWINNCVGWGNHAHFIFFLFFASIGCFQASIILSCSLYRAIMLQMRSSYAPIEYPIVILGFYAKLLTVLALGFSVGVVIAVGMLFVFQMRSLLRNRTEIENWILEKANYRRRNSNKPFIYPYDLGAWKNFRQVINLSCEPIGDGVTWSVKPGCDQYTLTKEQIEQKDEKRQRTKLYKIVENYSGSWFPITKGIKTCINFPCNDETRIKLCAGDIVSVTRWRKCWLFGEKIQKGDDSLNRIRGWFPRQCAVECVEDFSNEHKSKKIK